jgi:serine/threonine protein kinase/Tol biopolymer transport system component
MVGRTIGAYQIVEKLGEGGMGEVYRATDTTLKRQVALKVLPDALASDADRAARLQREAELLASLNHPNIAAIYGVERANGVLALVMELVEGPTLADRMAAGAIPIDQAMPIARQIADALEAAHEQGIVHRDLKPANVKVRPDGTVKLHDFGLAKAVGSGGETRGPAPARPDSLMVTSPAIPAGMTQAGIVLGTPAYMSPEQAQGKPPDRRSDIWAFGVLLAEMTSGRRPFEGESAADTLAAVLTRDPDLERLPPSVRRLVRRCLARDPRERLRHIGDALALVDDPRPVPTTEPRRRRTWWPYAAAVVTLGAVGLAVGWPALRPAARDDSVTRFSIEAPPGAAFNYTYTASAISPDGRQLVSRIATATESPALWLRPLDSMEGRRIAGTDGADFPFWSPDGRSIGFFSSGTLRRVDPAGGTPIVLCDAPDSDVITAGGSWSRDGVIVFGSPEGLYRVSASGGGPATLFAPTDVRAGETGYGSPQFLPDGDRLLFFVRHADPMRAGYYVSSVSRPGQKTLLLATESKAIFVANEQGDSSYLLYLQGRTVLARGVDRRTVTLTGDPVAVAANVARFPPGFHGAFWSSESGNLLAYHTSASDEPRLTWVHPDGTRKPAAGAEEFYTHVRVSRDGTLAALELADGTGNLDVLIRDFARGTSLRQTFDPAADRSPTWAPDGRAIAFSSVRTGEWQLFLKDVTAGRPEEQLTTGEGHKILPEWSRDGQFLIYIHVPDGTAAEDIWALPLEGDRQPFPVLQTPAVETHPALSPDGRWLAYESTHTGRPEVFVTAFPQSRSAVPPTAPRWQVSTQGGSRPRWSSDGRALFYPSLDDLSILRADVRGTASGLEHDLPRTVAEIPLMPAARSPFDVADGNRLLVLERTISQRLPLTIVANWRALMAGR